MEMPSEEKIQEWRRKCADGTMELAEYKEAIQWLRHTRGKLPDPPAAKAKSEKAPKGVAPSIDVQKALAAFLAPKA